METIYDLAIVGAGPAGATFARLMANSTKRIVLLNAQPFRPQKPCGGLLAPDAQRALARFDLPLPREVLVDPQLFSVRTFDLVAGLVRYYPRHYINMDRAAFDAWLRSLVGSGVEQRDALCTAARRAEDSTFVLTLHTHQGTQTLRARAVVGADGAHSRIRRSFFTHAPACYTAIQQWYATRADATPFYSCIFDTQTSQSCSWTIQKNGYFLYGGCFAPQGARAAYLKQKQRLQQRYGFPQGEALRTEACSVVRVRTPADMQCGKAGVFLLGEAAGFISPSSYEGISYALNSAHCLYRAFQRGGDNAAVLRAYRRATRGLRLKLLSKVAKHFLLYTPLTRWGLLRSGIQSISPYRR